MTERPRRQEQERATAEVTEVAPGILRTQLPIDMPGLGHVNCYVLEDERGVAIVDPGLPGRATLKTLTERLASAGIPLKRVHTVVVTHSHPDHFGGAGWVRNETGAEIVTHERFTHDLGPPRPAGRRRRGRRRGAASREQPDGPQAVGPAAVGWRGLPVLVPAADAHAGVQAPAPPVPHADADASASPTARRSAWPGGSGSPCTRRATPRTTSACSTRPSG